MAFCTEDILNNFDLSGERVRLRPEAVKYQTALVVYYMLGGLVNILSILVCS